MLLPLAWGMNKDDEVTIMVDRNSMVEAKSNGKNVCYVS